MSREDRLPILPTRGALVMLKTRTTAASRGYTLLKRKADALQFRFHSIIINLISTKIAMTEAVKDASFSLAEMRFVTGEMISPVIIEGATKARTKIRSWTENVAGVKITMFQSYQEGNDDFKLAGLSRGGQQLAAVKLKFENLINLLVKLASLQTNFVTFDNALKLTNRRVAAIEHIVLPRLWNTMHYFESELEEFDREDFYRIKKLKDKKKGKSYAVENKQPEKIPPAPPKILNAKCTCHTSGK